MPKYSIVIPTLGRDEQVDVLIKSIIDSGLKSFETIIIDQNEDDRLVPIVKKYKALKIKHIKADFKSLPKAKNLGAQKAKGDYVLFADDDCEFLSDTASKIEELLEKINPDVLSGRAVDRDGKDAVSAFAKDKCYLDMSNYNHRYVEFTEVFKREIALKYLFDPDVGCGNFYGAGEGQDQMIRMLRDGVKVYYSSDLKFYHPVKINDHQSKGEIKRSFFYACGYAYVCKKNNVKDADIRMKKLLLYIPYCFFFKRKFLKYYIVELAGLIAGKYVELK